ncbi:MAG: selenium cofactor biosynthesis protein YqeC, partial [Syntrophorhabdaceae bacterium]
LASACRARNKSVAITTTTKIFATPPFALFDDWLKTPDDRYFARIGKTLENGKLTGLDNDEIEALGRKFDVVLIEADGAKGLPLKYPANHEPVIPVFTQKVLIIAGMDALFRPFPSVVFRHELMARQTGIALPRLVYPDIFVGLFSDDALLKNTGGFERTIILNKYDSYRHRHMPAILLEKIMKNTGIKEGVIAAAKYGVWYVMNNI